MSRHAAVLLAAFAFAGLVPAGTARADDAPRGSVATPSARHVADAALRTAMSRVRDAVDAFGHAQQGNAGPDRVRALAEQLDGQVARVFSECRLEPRADASLHVILLTIAKASRVVRATPTDFAPVDAMERAMADYARVFDDGGEASPR